MKKFRTIAFLWFGGWLAGGGAMSRAETPAFTVGFDQSAYQVQPGDSFSVRVQIPALPQGLFSYGITLSAPADKAGAARSEAIVVPTPLDFNGVAGAGALKQIQPGTLSVKGTIDFNVINAAYKGVLLTTFTLNNQAELGQAYTLTLDLFRTLGPGESIFVDGTGTALDPLITFQSAQVTVIPEPSVLCLEVIFGLALLLFKTREDT